MHVVLFTMNMTKGGTERVISNLCNEYLIKKYKVSIVTYLKWDCEYRLDKAVGTYSLNVVQTDNAVDKLAGFITVGKAYKKLMQQIKADIVLAFLPRPCLIACLMRSKLCVPVIGSYRSNPEYDMQNLIIRFWIKIFFNRADGFVFQTEEARKFFHRKLQQKSAVIMNPLNNEIVCANYQGERTKRIVSVGRVTEEKNYPLLIRAFAGMDRSYEDYTLWIYGKYDGRLQLRELAESLGVKDRVVFAGQTNDVFHAIQDAALFILSSKTEGVPNALMEAMAIGLPVIATDCPCGGPRALVQNWENGILVTNGDEEALTKAMNEMLADSDRASRMGEKAMDIGRQYSGQKIYEKWDKYIMSIVRNGGKKTYF